MIKRVIRIGGFVAKELIEVIRQPRLLLSLILGPFLILLLFGIGYVGEKGELSAILVLPNEEAYTSQQEFYREQFGKQLNVVDITVDEASATNRLRNNEVDIVVLVPKDAAKRIGEGGQARLPVLYNSVDPVRSAQIIGSTLLYTGELNKQTVALAVQRSQGSAEDIDKTLSRVDASLASAEQNMANGDRAAAAGNVSEAQGSLTVVQFSLGLLSTLVQAPTVASPGGGQVAGAPSAQVQNLAESEDAARDLSSNISALQTSLEDPNADPATVRERIRAVRQDIANMRALTSQFASLNPFVLAAPFYGEAKNISPLSGGSTSLFTIFYTPGVLALLLQHIAITLASLSMVRERMLGSIELFRVSPITPGEILAGKYIGFGIFLSVLSVVLVALTTLALGVPILGDYLWLAAVLLLVIWASLGLGFLISMISGTESQAVQIAMLTLLTSVFFSGFFLRLDTLWEPVRALSYALPVTHGIIGLQSVMLNGSQPNWIYLAALGGLGILFAAFSMWRFSAEFRRG